MIVPMITLTSWSSCLYLHSVYITGLYCDTWFKQCLGFLRGGRHSASLAPPPTPECVLEWRSELALPHTSQQDSQWPSRADDPNSGLSLPLKWRKSCGYTTGEHWGHYPMWNTPVTEDKCCRITSGLSAESSQARRSREWAGFPELLGQRHGTSALHQFRVSVLYDEKCSTTLLYSDGNS